MRKLFLLLVLVPVLLSGCDMGDEGGSDDPDMSVLTHGTWSSYEWDDAYDDSDYNKTTYTEIDIYVRFSSQGTLETQTYYFKEGWKEPAISRPSGDWKHIPYSFSGNEVMSTAFDRCVYEDGVLTIRQSGVEFKCR